MSTGQISLGIIIFYLVAMLVITVWNGHKKKQKSAEGFFLANRGVSSVLLPLTMIAANAEYICFSWCTWNVLYPWYPLYCYGVKPGMGSSYGGVFWK